MTGIRSIGRKAALAALCGLLVACGGEPSEADMRAAVEGDLAKTNAQLGAVGRLVGADATIKVKALRKLACVQPKEQPGYSCDYEATFDGPLGENTRKASARFVKSDTGWTVLN